MAFCFQIKKQVAGITKTNTRTYKEKRDFSLSTEIPCSLMAGPMGLEPTASGVTGRRYNRLNYDPAFCFRGGRYRDRTYDPRLVRPTLSQLS